MLDGLLRDKETSFIALALVDDVDGEEEDEDNHNNEGSNREKFPEVCVDRCLISDLNFVVAFCVIDYDDSNDEVN